jgi:myo-inositol 2-dehydrogenase/D-chiro-inositol 1-dehydrogenase
MNRAGKWIAFRLGIAGIGNVSSLNAPGCLEHPGCELLALCDPRLDKARPRPPSGMWPRVYGSFEELLADDDIDAVELLTPTHLHAEHVIAAAEAAQPRLVPEAHRQHGGPTLAG